MRRIAVILVVLATAAGAVVAGGATSTKSEGKRYRIVVDNAFGLTEGGEVKIGGVTAGVMRDFELDNPGLENGEPVRVAVLIEVTTSGFDSLRSDATCAVRQQSLIGEYFLDCQIGKDGEELPDGGEVPVEQTASTIPLDLIQSVQRRPFRERFRLIISELGAGLAGRPAELNEVIRRAHPALRETTQTLEILARQNQTIKEFITDADRLSHTVAPRRQNLVRWAKEASETATVQASRREDLARNWNRLPVFLEELRPTMQKLQLTADEQIPLLERVRTAAPRLESFLAALGPFAEASRGSIRALGDASAVGRRAIVESGEEIDMLRDLARYAPRLGRPLRQFLQAIDDRSRSTEEDPLAAELAPPAPDKTAYKQGQGFTGMESLWNYVYYQALATNAFDEISHVLRIVAVQSPCAPYNPNPNEKQVEQCSAWLGPNQPGVNRPDPTDGPALQSAGSGQRELRESTSALDYLLGP
jgi:ABC-type transporter Mla subunit MlaD